MSSFVRLRATILLAAVGALLIVTAGRTERWALLAGGVAVALGVGIEGRRALAAVRSKRAGAVWFGYPTAALLIVSIGCWCWAGRSDWALPVLLAVAIMLAVLGLLHRLPVDSADLRAARLPDTPSEPPPLARRPYGWVTLILLGWLALAVIAGALGLVVVVRAGVVLAGVVLIGAIVAAVGMLWIGWDRGPFGRPTIQRALRAYGPAFVMPYNSYYHFHIAMWEPYLRRTGERVVVVTTDERSFREVAKRGTLPVVYSPDTGPRPLRALFPPSVRAAWYVHNGRHSHFLKVPGVTHVFLHHGDSDKHTSAATVSSRYDILVVAGQAAVDRYAAEGIAVDPRKFRLLGRPQTELIATLERPRVRTGPATVLYAPTWFPTTPGKPSYSSLLLGPRIVATVLRAGQQVIFRPHAAMRSYPPAAEAIRTIHAMLAADEATTGHHHLYGRAADRLTVAECTNLADAMISDVSGIVTDFMQSLKPYAMMAMIGTPAEFGANFPTSQGGYLIDRELNDFESVLDCMLGADPLFDVRRERRRYYLGDLSGPESAEAFVAFARSLAGRSSQARPGWNGEPEAHPSEPAPLAL